MDRSAALTRGESFADALRALPDHCTTVDGRKVAHLPTVLYIEDRRDSAVYTLEDREDNLTVCAGSPDDLYHAIADVVTSYRRRLLDEFSNLGYLVFEDHGRFRVAPALVPREVREGELYSAAGDTRPPSHYFTVDRDVVGIQYEVETFEALIDRENVSEFELQRFFEENPHFLTLNQFEAIPQPMFPRSERGPLIPDFILRPIVAQQRDSRWEVLDLKLPQVRLTAGPPDRPRLSHHVHQALAQLRDYRNYFQQDVNARLVEEVLGHRLRRPRLAVLIGRMPQGAGVEALEAAQAEQTVRIVTYDEILEGQRRFYRSP
jgi:hypothetical protein